MYDPYTGKRLGEESDKVSSSSKFGKKMPKKLPSDYGKL